MALAGTVCEETALGTSRDPVAVRPGVQSGPVLHNVQRYAALRYTILRCTEQQLVFVCAVVWDWNSFPLT